jgi:hypothetical protein
VEDLRASLAVTVCKAADQARRPNTRRAALAAADLAPSTLTTAGHVSRGRPKELAEAAVNLAQYLSAGHYD